MPTRWVRKSLTDPRQYEVDDSGCWNWIGTLSHNGYASMSVDYKHRRATHVFLKEISGIDVPKGMHADHLCYNRKCVNPDHLEVVEPIENFRRKRNLKLSMDQADTIRERYNSGAKQTELAEEYGTNQSNISRIINHKRWACA
jgi:hypothetical protein